MIIAKLSLDRRTFLRGAGVDVDALEAPCLACLPRQIVLEMLNDREAAEHGVSEVMAAQLPRRRHHPAHAERGANLLRVAPTPRPRTYHFL